MTSTLLASCRDLSFNRLEGNVPDLGGLAKLELVFLTSNLLTGSIPEWIKNNIVFKSTISSYSLGRQIFDVYIQEKLELKDFNIENEAQGLDKAVIKNFTVVVTNKVLMIRFHWAGKGTTAAPNRGIYGPLVSAISVESDFSPPVDSKIVAFFGGRAVWEGGYQGKKINQHSKVHHAKQLNLDYEQMTCLGIMHDDWSDLVLRMAIIELIQIKAATNNFNAAKKIREGGFGSVYKGILLDGTTIAVKQLSSKSKQGSREFVTEIGMMENNSLARALFGPASGQLKLDWLTRQKICAGIARGLAFLHEESTLKIVHRDIKSTNILLDGDLNPKISNFGLAKLYEEENTHISTRIARTISYMAPEYALWGILTYKADVYSFGVVALEIIIGKNNMKYRPNENCVCLLNWAMVLQQNGNLMELVDPELGSEFSKEEATIIIKVALLCINPSPALRPTMTAVVSMLEGRTVVPELTMEASIYANDVRFESFRGQCQTLRASSSDRQSLLQSSNATWIGSSSTSAHDFYSINLDSSNMKRMLPISSYG
ncbi:probable leucine-rich repeat receptor-like serine/threonine-protein kinase At3g14840 [Quercus robur]|uniref:probable leucine-rich repeat receptor-like serine/threonine-protein kinase At3g14840 n=1 Tax=Quercus robur TaxID=38942 RepID=UPI002161A371|nr:probable leucine-rich repeat receptor-like serine/threonine-protein kinase At3g14840 [Quercus robur]